MEEYIKKIIPNIRQSGTSLSYKEKFTNKIWYQINQNNDLVEYMFKKNGVLVISTNGNVKKGIWELLSSKKLLFENSSGSFQLDHLFFDENIMILLKRGKVEEMLILVDTEVIKDKNPLNYLEKVRKKQPSPLQEMISWGLFIISLAGLLLFIFAK